MSNFIGLAYAVVKQAGYNTNKMSTDEVVDKYNELQKKTGQKEATPKEQQRLQELGIEDKPKMKNSNSSGSKGGEEKEKKSLDKKKIQDSVKKIKSYIKSGKLPDGIEPQENLGGTMDINGNPIDMKRFKNGYLVSCGNDSYPENKEYLMNSDFIERFMEKADTDELFIGSWYENGENTNEPTIWVEDRNTAIELAKLTGQYAITDCAKYNEYRCENYKLLTTEQKLRMEEIFIGICNEEEHKKKLKEIDL